MTLLVSIIFSVCLIVFVNFAIPFMYCIYERKKLQNKTTSKRAIVLTFDDGPGNRLTPKILEILKEHNIKSSFFLCGRNIEGRESLVKQILADGHDVGSHSYSHFNHWKVSPFKVVKDIKRGSKAIDNALGVKKGRYEFRPPGGKLNILSLTYLLFAKIPICYWTIISGDTYPQGQRSVDTVASAIQAKGGGVVLAHDFDRGNDQTDKFVLDSLKKTIDCAYKNNFYFMTFSELNRN